MRKRISGVVLWILGIICIFLVCKSMIQPLTEEKVLYAEEYLYTETLKGGDVLEQTIEIKRAGLCQIEIGFCYDIANVQNCQVQIEVLQDGQILMQQKLLVMGCPNNSFMPFVVSGADIGEATIRVTNVSSEGSEEGFSLLYTQEYVGLNDEKPVYTVNGMENPGQLITRYTFETGYDYYKALTISFGILLFCIIADRKLYNK